MNIYDDDNAYIYDAPFKQTPRPGVRDSYSGTAVLPGTSTVAFGHPYGHTTATIEEMNRREIVLGQHSRKFGTEKSVDRLGKGSVHGGGDGNRQKGWEGCLFPCQTPPPVR